MTATGERRATSGRWCVALAACALAAACVEAEATDATALAVEGTARGSVSCDFDLPLTMNLFDVPAIIERDRMYMAARPGLQRKHLPMSPSVPGLNLKSGGRYLFDTRADADRYLAWVADDFALDGTAFFARDYILAEVCRARTVVGTEDFVDVHGGNQLIRTSRFVSLLGRSSQQLRALWLEVRDGARRRGMSAVTMSYDAGARTVEVVQVAPLGLFTLTSLALDVLVDGLLLLDGQVRTFDRTQLVMSVWFPFVDGDQGEPSLWPNAPLLPAPSCGDGVCEVSRGEDGAACDVDCPPRCGDAVCQPADGEDTQTCPGDCRLETP